ncbi:hypothetical protein [Serratia aquatilis]|uniref:Uncharacterized protein n=1 Tax=Serratia aquatilis TaxID=1737515 RepID=A0ABV6E8G5_9GAMM
MTEPNRVSSPPEITASESLVQTLHDYFIHRILPLERQYTQLIARQYATLNQLMHRHKLEAEQRDELVSWIAEIRRTLSSHRFAEGGSLTRPPNEFTLWALFGASSHQGVKNNIDSFCQRRICQIDHLQKTLLNFTSLSALQQQLEKRKCKEPHIARFLDESPKIYTTL